MTLYGFYTDESGNNGFSDILNQPVLTYAGVLVPLEKQVYLNNEIEKILNNLKIDIKAKISGIPKKELNKLNFFQKFEIHGKDFIDGENFYGNLSFDERVKVVEKILELVQHEDYIIVASVVNKDQYKKNKGNDNHNHMHISAYTDLVKLLNVILIRQESHAFIICDDGKESEINNLCDALRNPINKVIYPDPQIKLSHDKNCNLIQLADLINFITTIYFRSSYNFPPRKRHQKEIIKLYETYLKNKIEVVEYK